MGLFSFIENVGKKIFSSEKPEEKVTKIHDEIKSMDLPAHVSVEVDGKNVKISGNATDQATKEKIILAVGNIHGIDSVQEDIVVPEAKATAQFVTVKTGDTLSKIAKETYGDANKYHIIFAANKPMLKDADDIYPGQKIRIPALENETVIS